VRFASALSLALGLLAMPAAARAERDVVAELEQQQITLFARVAPAVIFIGDERSLGTGFFVSQAGLALTAAHVVAGEREVNVVLHGGKRTRAKVIASRTDLDLALLQVAIGRVPQWLPLATTVDLRVGQWVGAVGHGLGGVWAFTVGMVSNLYEAKLGAEMVQTQIPLNPGNSGGPIFDRTGRAVAVVSKGATTGNSINLGVHVADAFIAFEQLLPHCACLAIDVPTNGTAVFLDDELAGKGPRVLVKPTPGSHTVSAVIGGRRIERTIRFPADRRVVLGTRP
jgi:S1-C subfamily serine protease